MENTNQWFDTPEFLKIQPFTNKKDQRRISFATFRTERRGFYRHFMTRSDYDYFLSINLHVRPLLAS